MAQVEVVQQEITDEVLHDAEVKVEKALELQQSDNEQAAELLGQALQVYVKKYGETDPKCAPVYLQYGLCLFKAAQSEGDVFGEQMKQAADRKAAEKIIEAEADPEAKDEEEEETPEDEESEDDADDDAEEAEEPAAGDASEACIPSTDEGAPAVEDVLNNGEGEEDDEDGEEEEAGEEEEDGDGMAAKDGEDVELPDDMSLAWENIEAARIIYETMEPRPVQELAEVYLTLGEIHSEQDKFEASLEEYRKGLECLEGTEGNRRLKATFYFKMCLSNQMLDAHEPALDNCQKAIALLEDHLASASEGEVEEIRLLISDLKEKAVEIQGDISTHATMKETLMEAFKAVAAGGDAEEMEGPAETKAQDLGVVGRGKSRISPTPIAATGEGAAAGTCGAKRGLEAKDTNSHQEPSDMKKIKTVDVSQPQPGENTPPV